MTDDKRRYKDEMLARMYRTNAPVTKVVETDFSEIDARVMAHQLEKFVDLNVYCQKNGIGEWGGNVIEAIIEDHKRLADLVRRREKEVERKDGRIRQLEAMVASGEVPSGKFAYVADKRRRQAESCLAELRHALRLIENPARELLVEMGRTSQPGYRWPHLAAEQIVSALEGVKEEDRD